MSEIAATSIVDKSARIGANVRSGHFCVIGADVCIGDNTTIHNNVTIVGHTTLGAGNTVFPGAVLGTQPQDLKYAGEPTELRIGDNNIIREFTTFNPGTANGKSLTQIGSNNLFMAYTHIAHDCNIGSHCVFSNNASLAGHLEIGDYVTIGGLSGIHQFVRIGKGAMLAGASALGQDVPPFCIAQGNHATLKGLNRYRMRQLLEREEIDRIAALYKRLFSGKEVVREAAEDCLHNNEPYSELVAQFCEFILQSTRGIPVINRTRKDDE